METVSRQEGRVSIMMVGHFVACVACIVLLVTLTIAMCLQMFREFSASNKAYAERGQLRNSDDEKYDVDQDRFLSTMAVLHSIAGSVCFLIELVAAALIACILHIL